MGKFIKPALVLLIFLSMGIVFPPSGQAAGQIAKPSKLTLQVSIDDPKVFWDFVYLTRDGDFAKAASVQIGWGLSDVSKSSKYEVAVARGKSEGHMTIVTEKGALVNYRISVRDAHNNEIGSLGLQVQNKGQTEYITVAHPDYTEPIISYGNEAPKASEPF